MSTYPHLRSYDAETILRWFEYHMDGTVRAALRTEHPEAYGRWLQPAQEPRDTSVLNITTEPGRRGTLTTTEES